MTRRLRRATVARAAIVGALAAGLLAGCAAAGSAPAGVPDPAPDSLAGTLVVQAAASLTGSMDEVARDFESVHPGVTVTVSYGGSSTLAQQIVQGAPADVFASASDATMTTVVDAGETAADPRVFARNALEIAVPPGNPGRVAGLADFADPARTLALCAPEVPCGAAAAQAFAAAGITPQPDSLEQDVRAALTRVELGEVDAAVIYETDVRAAGDEVEGVPLPDEVNATTDCVVAPLAGSASPALAAAFAEYVAGDDARAVFQAAGFRAP
ncbi:molybdate ABC transporter substrate-binding protein [Clavibacter michiganensis]|uniref:molybdate ABC transporter substrate-binding protein n=1 Tax=Clavibacter michiganensis TaxID=28447 RepID=UPI0026DA890A|nr:molybdate ABC transporter substrate-binding protein [Clavibacter michiganensis]MDO4025154.1 molybdate ABC transporter substrate-binding protein [Clavibacter michiganensis]MDO4033812.1 molybdate ABC transporter substrate-binding protein [Clavibacter michiganensis]MDO4047013.1 molybdate ABC transporter substrate-binding protein [Clavibacter michiganensis]MDO4105555.1 molybdate ABC transporter substrate-binding protein [Clavibacter michiganensis]MDO4131072.1 molybdate ABC transporter substrate